MAQILGLGTTHSPPLSLPESAAVAYVHQALDAPNADAHYRDRANWPRGMLEEMASDEGASASQAHRTRMIENFRKQRKLLDEFRPDFVVIFGDDQYENFQEDIIPPFCIYGLDDRFEAKPWKRKRYIENGNAWDEPEDWAFDLRGHRDGAKFLTTELIRRGVCMPYAYKTLHQELIAHAFLNTLLYLDYDRAGFPYPVVPFHVNCYGSEVLGTKGGHRAHLFRKIEQVGLPDPPGPSAAMCMDVGRLLAKILMPSPYRVALIASSSWSHAALSSNTKRMIPDHESDRRMLEAFRNGEYGVWRAQTTEQLTAAGQHEIFNWMLLAGAMEELKRKPTIDDYLETWLFQSNKVFASFRV
jgi:hypothetical protein